MIVANARVQVKRKLLTIINILLNTGGSVDPAGRCGGGLLRASIGCLSSGTIGANHLASCGALDEYLAPEAASIAFTIGAAAPGTAVCCAAVTAATVASGAFHLPPPIRTLALCEFLGRARHLLIR